MTAPARQEEVAGAARREQTRARYPEAEGYVERDGQRLFYEVYGEGDGEETLFLIPTWSLATGRCRSRTSRATSGFWPWTAWATAARTAAAILGVTEPRRPLAIAWL